MSSHFPAGPSNAIMTLRRRMMDADINSLTFHSMDSLYGTAPVKRSSRPNPLPRAANPFEFNYEFQGVIRSSSQFPARTFTNALLIIKNGEIVLEDYFNNTNAATTFISWSMAKSILSLMIGVALNEGLIRGLDDLITDYVPELKGTGYDGVSLRQALQMRSGVDWDERYDFGAEPSPAAAIFEEALVCERRRYADAALDLKPLVAPGERFNYSTVETAVLGWLLERATGGPVADYTAAKLWEPIGSEADAFWIRDGAPGVGREFTGAGFNSTLRDFGRLGLLVLNEGQVNGRSVVPADWVKESTAPYAGEKGVPEGPMNYGYQWWTLKGTPSFLAVGLLGQFIFIDPPSKTVVVKLSHFQEPEFIEGPVTDESVAFFKAAAAWAP